MPQPPDRSQEQAPALTASSSSGPRVVPTMTMSPAEQEILRQIEALPAPDEAGDPLRVRAFQQALDQLKQRILALPASPTCSALIKQCLSAQTRFQEHMDRQKVTRVKGFPGPGLLASEGDFALSIRMTPAEQEVLDLLDAIPSPGAARTRSQFDEMSKTLRQIEAPLDALPPSPARLALCRKFDAIAIFYRKSREEKFSHVDGSPMRLGEPLLPDIVASIPYSQDRLFPKSPGVCSALCFIFVELRTRGWQVRDILSTLASPAYKASISSLQDKAYASNQTFELGLGLLRAPVQGRTCLLRV